ncbi:MAG: MFS transporter [Anaerolineaceae bacterium]
MKRFLVGGKSQLAVLASFFTNGAVMATWAARIPTIQTKLGMDKGTLGLILFGLALGMITALSLVGGLIARFGSAKMTRTGGLILCATLPLLALVPNPVTLFFTLFVFGAAMSSMDIAMNEQAVQIEQKTGRTLMSSFHAGFSIGGLAGALLGAGMAALPSITPFLHFALVAFLFIIVVLVCYPHLLQGSEARSQKQAAFRLPERALWAMGAIAFCSVIAETSMADWSAVYLTNVLSTNASLAALGYAAFSLTMTVGRLTGDFLVRKWKPAAIVRAGSTIAGLGLAAIITTSNPFIAIAGFALVGLGLANIVPLTFSAAGNFPGIPAGIGIASVATFGYVGSLIAAPIIGAIAEATSLRVSMLLIGILVSTLLISARSIAHRERG